MAKKNTYNKKKFLLFFCIAIGICAGVRHIFSINMPINMPQHLMAQDTQEVGNHLHVKKAYNDSTIYDEIETDEIEEGNSVSNAEEANDSNENGSIGKGAINEEGSGKNDPAHTQDDSKDTNNRKDGITCASIKEKHKIKGVWSYKECFPDIQDTQIIAAKKYGIQPVRDRNEAERLVKERRLVNITHSPYYVVDDLTHSIPYLVPRAQHLLNTISMNFIDSCYAKGVPTHLLMVTSVLRTTDDVSSLQRGNKNATTNSCHCYGTTVDIAYNRFMPLGNGYDPNISLLRWNEPMKRILSEVLFDLRNNSKCYVKYERKQGCFHLTCR